MKQTYISSVSSDNMSKENICGWTINPLSMQKWGEAPHFFLADLTSYGVVTNTRIYDFVTYFAYKIKSCQNQNLCFKSFNSHSDKGFRKDLQSILASSVTSSSTLAQIS